MKTVTTLPEKYLLTISEAAVYFNVGEHTIRRVIQNNPGADFILMNGSRQMVKKRLFEEYLDRINSL